MLVGYSSDDAEACAWEVLLVRCKLSRFLLCTSLLLSTESSSFQTTFVRPYELWFRRYHISAPWAVPCWEVLVAVLEKEDSPDPTCPNDPYDLPCWLNKRTDQNRSDWPIPLVNCRTQMESPRSKNQSSAANTEKTTLTCLLWT